MKLLRSPAPALLLLGLISRAWAISVRNSRSSPVTVAAADTTHSGNSTGGNTTAENGGHGAAAITTLPIVTWKWHHVELPYLITLWVLVCWLVKLVLHLYKRLTIEIPESAMLILFGFILGGMIWGADKAQTFALQPRTFFFFLLPQIILDAGYFMPNKLFFSNMGAILIFAIIGTVWNAVAVGLSLYGVYLGGAMGNLDIDILQFMLFGSLLSAVDPVAVLAVFEEVHVNEVLFILVFGESLLNDGVTVVLYNVCDAFVSLGADKINAAEIIKGIVSFLVVAFGGSLIGVVFAILLSLLTRCTKNLQIIEPGFIFVVSYLSYLTAEMLSLSSILAITFCGVCCQKYVNANMAESSVTTVKYAMKVLANGSETIIFVFLGISAIDPNIWVWNTGFILLTVLFVLVYRIIGVFVLTWMLNRYRLIPIEIIDQVIMSYGGLRGGVAYGLAVLLDQAKIKEKNLMLCTTLIVVYFTVILQGVTMKPLVTWLKVKRSSKSELCLIEKLQNRAFDHILVAIEDISGQIGHNYMREKWNKFEERFIRPLLMKTSARKSQDQLFNVFHQLNLKDAISYVAEGERCGSLDFARSDNDANLVFKKKFGADLSDIIPDINSDLSDKDPYDIPLPSRENSLPSVCLDVEEEMRRKEVGDNNAHHLLQTHLYKARKQHRHRYSRKETGVNKDENEVQEIFQRTMRSRLESFKSTKMGVSQNKKLKPSKKDQVSNGNVTNHTGDDEGGIENPAFMPDAPPQTPPWSSSAQAEYGVAPSQMAQLRIPWSPGNLHRLAPLRISTRSNDSFLLADRPTTEEEQQPPNQPCGMKK
ncbi:sodium/hydrogen exchanger 3.1 [Scleropages formosus]|uniref:Sodium/hydrogen exchanger n=1 Tax=Scleropages formosus TaxID=113540 RepID=A0A8C9RMA6_SCLFO|nr:sodium/hydrogen exchanger 3 [Scleropages formosus]